MSSEVALNVAGAGLFAGARPAVQALVDGVRPLAKLGIEEAAPLARDTEGALRIPGADRIAEKLRAAGEALGIASPKVPPEVVEEHPHLALGRRRPAELFATNENPRYPKALDVANDDLETSGEKLLTEIRSRVDPGATRTRAVGIFGETEGTNAFGLRAKTIVQKDALTAIRQAYVDKNGQAFDLLLWPASPLNRRSQPVGRIVLKHAPTESDLEGLRSLVRLAGERAGYPVFSGYFTAKGSQLIFATVPMFGGNAKLHLKALRELESVLQEAGVSVRYHTVDWAVPQIVRRGERGPLGVSEGTAGTMGGPGAGGPSAADTRSVREPEELGDERGGVPLPGLIHAAAGGLAGGAAGAALDEEDRARGALVGAGLGAGLGLGLGAIRGRPTRAIPLAEEARPPVESAPREGLDFDAATKAANAYQGPVDPQDHAKLATFALDPTGEKRLAAEVERVVREEQLAPKARVTWSQARQLAAVAGADPAKIMARSGCLSGPEMLAIRHNVRANTEAVMGLEEQLAQDGEALLTGERDRLQRLISSMDAQSNVLLGRFIKERSQTGRDLNNLKILASRTLDLRGTSQLRETSLLLPQCLSSGVSENCIGRRSMSWRESFQRLVSALAISSWTGPARRSSAIQQRQLEQAIAQRRAWWDSLTPEERLAHEEQVTLRYSEAVEKGRLRKEAASRSPASPTPQPGDSPAAQPAPR